MLRARSAVSATQVHSKGGMDHGQCSGGVQERRPTPWRWWEEMTSQNGTGTDGETSLTIRESHTAPSYALLEPGGGD